MIPRLTDIQHLPGIYNRGANTVSREFHNILYRSMHFMYNMIIHHKYLHII